MALYTNSRSISGEEVRVGDLIYNPYGDTIIEVAGTRTAVVEIDGLWRTIVILSGWYCKAHLFGREDIERTWSDDIRHSVDRRILKLLGDVRDAMSPSCYL